LPKHKRTVARFHLTALDIHPAIIARNLVFLVLLDQLAAGQTINPETKAEIIATYMYAFLGVFMPGYCHKRCAWQSLLSPPCDSITICRLMAILDDLRDCLSVDPSRLPSWIFMPATSIPPVLGVINYWIDTAKTAKTEKALELHNVPDTFAPAPPGMGPGSTPPNPNITAGRTTELMRGIVASSLEGMTNQQLVETGSVPAHISTSQARQYFETHKSQLIDALTERMKSLYPSSGNDIEVKWYSMTKALAVPKELEGRHTVLKQLSDAVWNDRDIPRALISKVAPPRLY
jgi:hypothetical protein